MRDGRLLPALLSSWLDGRLNFLVALCGFAGQERVWDEVLAGTHPWVSQQPILIGHRQLDSFQTIYCPEIICLLFRASLHPPLIEERKVEDRVLSGNACGWVSKFWC